MSERNSDRNISGRYLLAIFILLVVIILVLGLFRSCIGDAASIKPLAVTLTNTSTPLVSTTVVDGLTMKSTITEILCNNQGKVETVFYEVITSGGESPYIYEVELSEEKLLGPFIRYENEPMLFKVDGGKSFTLTVKSFDDKQLKRMISPPTTDRRCKKTEDALAGTPATSTVITTLTLTAATSIYPTTVTPTPSGTTTSISQTTTTPTPSRTATSKSSSTTTPTPSRTATTVAISTNTSTPSSTATTISLKTATPTLTETATPTPTSTIIPNPSLKECEDGIDNDGDNLIDYPADPQCTSRKDNKESR